MPVKVKQIIYKKHGDPEQVLQLEEKTLDETALNEHDVFVHWFAAPINPCDLYQIEGNFGGIQPPLPAIAGNEGCGVVEAVGPKVHDLRPGDLVIPSGLNGFGTWRNYGVHEEKFLFRLDDASGNHCHHICKHSQNVAASILINPVTAYKMLKDFVELQKGDYVVLNGASSNLGRYVIQFCRHWGVKTICVVRDRPEIDDLKSELKDLGATEVHTQEEFTEFVNLAKHEELDGVRLALDCVGGTAGVTLALALDKDGTYVQYGRMAGEDGHVSRKDIKSETFAIANWYKRGNEEERMQVYAEIAKMLQDGDLKAPPFAERSVEDFKDAIKASQESADAKQIFVFSHD
ncbi:CBN-MECR-1 protein [Aphelenchoides avenae]|nr:CBN-MECR-1 protein [Aphelenchus avenae]